MNLTEQEKARLAELKAKTELTEEEKVELAELEKKEKGDNGDDKKPDLEKLIQQAEDRVRTKYSKQMKELEDKLKAIEDKNLTEEERLAKEKKEKEDALIAKEAELNKKVLDFETLSILSEKGYGKELLNVLSGSNIEERTQQLTVIETLVNDRVAKIIKEKIGGGDPDFSNSKGGNKGMQYDLSKMSYDEQVELFLKNPDLYNQLLNK